MDKMTLWEAIDHAQHGAIALAAAGETSPLCKKASADLDAALAILTPLAHVLQAEYYIESLDELTARLDSLDALEQDIGEARYIGRVLPDWLAVTFQDAGVSTRGVQARYLH